MSRVLKESNIEPSLPLVTAEPLDLVHSDLCGKINEKSLSGAEYFLTFIDDMYGLMSSNENIRFLKQFLEWKALVE